MPTNRAFGILANGSRVIISADNSSTTDQSFVLTIATESGTVTHQASINSLMGSSATDSADGNETFVVQPLSNGDFVVAWDDSAAGGTSGTTSTGFYFMVLDPSGNVVTSTTTISTTNVFGTDLNRFGRVAALENGDVAFSWVDNNKSPYLRIFNPDGTAVTAPILLSSASGAPSAPGNYNFVAVAAAGNTIMTVYTTNATGVNGYYVDLYNQNGTQIGTTFQASASG